MNNLRSILGIRSIVCLSLVITIVMTSCVSQKKLKYFQDLPDSEIVDLPPAPQEERLIEYGDALDIAINGKDPELAKMFSKATVAVGGDPGIIVDPQGNIEFPILGKIKVYGITARQLKLKMEDLVKVYMKEPIVDVKFYTFRVSVLGAVGSPGSFILPMQRTTILDALAAAGDLPIDAKRENIQLYRDYNGKRSITKIDLRKKEVLTNKDVFQLKHNDVLIVEPRGTQNFQQNLGIFTSIFGVVISVVTLTIFLSRDNN